MRANPGDSVVLFDGSGTEFTAVVEQLKRSEAELRITGTSEINRELPFPLIVGVALPKGDRQKWLVEKLTELGVTMLVPLVTERSVAVPSDNALERLRRSVIEAAKQCGRNRLMQITKAQSWKSWLDAAEHSPIIRNPQPAIRNYSRLVAHPSGLPLSEVVPPQLSAIELAIGPEGGFTDAEVEAATAAGWQTVSLGPRILRVETAAIAFAAGLCLRV
jgi:16S rRNA (uracil1498-N3)-methyltransferase